jgi:hypothetical protein
MLFSFISDRDLLVPLDRSVCITGRQPMMLRRNRQSAQAAATRRRAAPKAAPMPLERVESRKNDLPLIP